MNRIGMAMACSRARVWMLAVPGMILLTGVSLADQAGDFVRVEGAGLTLGGRPYRAIGVNIPHLPQAWMGTWFHRRAHYESKEAMVEAIEDAARHEVAFIRFFGTPVYPKETAALYLKSTGKLTLVSRCAKSETSISQ